MASISKLPSDFLRYKEVFVIQYRFGNTTLFYTQTTKPKSGKYFGAGVYFRVRPKKTQ